MTEFDASLLAPDDDEWESIHCKPKVFPVGIWGLLLGDGTILIKDTVSKGPYPNELVNNNTFEYYLPPNNDGNGGTTKEIKEAFFNELLVKDVRDKRRVRIFSMTESANHYLGEWVVQSIKVARSPVVSLRRLGTQRTDVDDEYAVRNAKRSRSESRHAPVIRAFFEHVIGGPVRLVHEPSALCDLQAPYVQRGKCTVFSADTYTIDYVVSDAAGAVSYGIESKSCIQDAMRPVAVSKCAYYRDKNMRRTLTFADHNEALRIVDFGAPVPGGNGGAIGTINDQPPRVYTLEEAKVALRRVPVAPPQDDP